MTDIPSTPGVYYGLPFSVYLQIDAANASLLWTMREKSPLHALYEREHPKPPTPALEFGRLFHKALLEPKLWADTVRTLPSDAPRRPTDRQRNAKNPSPATVAAVEWWDAWEADVKETITSDDAESIAAMCASVRASQCKNYTTGGRSEVTMVWKDDETGLLCKGRCDYLQRPDLGNDVITDVKTTLDASARGFSRAAYNFGYFLPAAYYSDAWLRLTGEQPFFVWLAVEKQPPYVAKAWEVDEKIIQAGRNAYRSLLNRWADCVARDTYPAYGDNVEIITFPDWALANEGVTPFNLEVA